MINCLRWEIKVEVAEEVIEFGIGLKLKAQVLKFFD